jgi:hypothetical protein
MTGILHENQNTFLIISRSALHRMVNVSDKCCRGNQKHILCSTDFSESRSVYEKFKSIVEPYRPELKIWCILIACCLPKATNTQSEYVILTAFPLQQWLHERTWMLRYMYIACFAIRRNFYCAIWSESLRKIQVSFRVKWNNRCICYIVSGLTIIRFVGIVCCHFFKEENISWFRFCFALRSRVRICLPKLCLVPGLKEDVWSPETY